MNKFFKKNDGFTLVELIVVIAIIAILSGAAVAGYSSYITKANEANVKSQLSELGTAIAAADAKYGVVQKVETKDGETFTVTLKENATIGADFANDLKAFYPGASYNADDKQIKLTTKIDLSKTSYTEATWSNVGWNFTTSTSGT